MKAESIPKFSPITQDFSAAAHILINRLGTKTRNSIIYVTSSTEDEGKSAVTANLALQLSEIEKKVLLVDLDTRRPSIGGFFLENVDYSRSLNALYQGDASKEKRSFPSPGISISFPLSWVIMQCPATMSSWT
ncbi:MAG: hypothetical protein IJ930_07375 [Lachnospiraceae bacterium]|nr:hypothetical protein [Lachnospiraceae bacterium]